MMAARRTFLKLLPLLLVAACSTTVGPDYRVPAQAVVARPEAATPFLGAADKPFSAQPLPAQWWRLYRDATLDGLVDKAPAANTDLRVAAANLERSRAVVAEAEQLQRPGVDLSAAPAFGRAAGAVSGVPHALPDRASYDTGLHVSYQLDLFGKIRRAVEAAGADADAAQAALDLARVTVAADTARAYARCLRHRPADRDRAAVRRLAGQVRALHRPAGEAWPRHRPRQQPRAGPTGTIARSAATIEAQRRAALYRLAVLTGDVPGRFPPAVAQCERAPQLASTIPVGDGAALLRRRPDIRQAERQLAATTARIGVATGELYPAISLGLSAGSSGTLSGFGEGNTLRYSLGPLISWSLPATGTARMHIAQAEAGTGGALARFDGVVLNALRETETALSTYARELDRNAALRAARDQSALAAQQADRLYRFGRTDFLTTLDAQRTLATSEAAVAASNAALASDQVTLFLALGGGWEGAPR
ncbi:efflux transporter outer membrane subunit [Massilia sp. Se16.2.3]|uniref:efflux transporter outer membrane subunit n=1 Tax=Massilia sp. Se16.2.3 TaxID=2709303 RepID=UPI001E6387DE|nr:efflux transporter outer membrane subunit [Massilia sp. Se16.2.3]